MKALFNPAVWERVMVLAPHPDDETLATTGFLQKAVAAGAAVRVLFATDGDNNPWPQRASERRWRITIADRARWGRRRRGEALAALASLGVPADSAHFLAWVPRPRAHGAAARWRRRTPCYLVPLALDQHRQIRTVPIPTVYLDGNRSSHFRPVIDSLRIYWALLGWRLPVLHTGSFPQETFWAEDVRKYFLTKR